MALESEPSRPRFKDIEQVPSYDDAHRTGLAAPFAEPPANEERGMSSLPLPAGDELRRGRFQAGLELHEVASHLSLRVTFRVDLDGALPGALAGIQAAMEPAPKSVRYGR